MLRSVALASRVGSHAAITRGLSAVRMQVATASSSPTLDERLIADEPELIKKTLRMRRADESMLQAVDRIGELTKLRAAAVAEGNDAREVRKKLSPKIGALVKNGETAEAEKLKAEVAQSATEADAADAKLEVFDAERTSLFNKLPNLLDERVVDGADDNANIEVFRWRCDDLRTGKLWHDEFGTQLGGNYHGDGDGGEGGGGEGEGGDDEGDARGGGGLGGSGGLAAFWHEPGRRGPQSRQSVHGVQTPYTPFSPPSSSHSPSFA